MSDVAVIELPERMDIAAAESTHVTLENVIQQGKPVSLSAANVNKLDTAGVQLLVGFFTEAKNQHIDIEWQDPSETILNTFTFLSLSDQVGLGEIAGANE